MVYGRFISILSTWKLKETLYQGNVQETKAIISAMTGDLGVVLERRPQGAVSHEVRRRGQMESHLFSSP